VRVLQGLLSSLANRTSPSTLSAPARWALSHGAREPGVLIVAGRLIHTGDFLRHE
jgi:hypothetical protein